MYQILFTNKMKHDLKLMKKRGKDISKLTAILNKLSKITSYQEICRILENVI